MKDSKKNTFNYKKLILLVILTLFALSFTNGIGAILRFPFVFAFGGLGIILFIPFIIICLLLSLFNVSFKKFPILEACIIYILISSTICSFTQYGGLGLIDASKLYFDNFDLSKASSILIQIRNLGVGYFGTLISSIVFSLFKNSLVVKAFFITSDFLVILLMFRGYIFKKDKIKDDVKPELNFNLPKEVKSEINKTPITKVSLKDITSVTDDLSNDQVNNVKNEEIIGTKKPSALNILDDDYSDNDFSIKPDTEEFPFDDITEGEEVIKPKDEYFTDLLIDDSKPYVLPPLTLLYDTSVNDTSAKNYEIASYKAKLLEDKMQELGIDAKISDFVVGPAVTRFEVTLSPGIRVSSFINLSEDFKLALAVNSLRIENPIPGKSAIGLEVPNDYISSVSLKEVITSTPNSFEKLYVPIGKDITGNSISISVKSASHMLICGATGSGKSVSANAIILSLLLRYSPDELKFIMIDPKKVELLFYEKIPHLMCPIITDSDSAYVALEKLRAEMSRRYDMFALQGAKNIDSYNEIMRSSSKPIMPYIFLIVDEFADLMLSKRSSQVEEAIQSLVQMGRSCGIHLILCTQRPDVKVITGTIKSNITCRLSFRVSSFVDSKTVIDVGGAEKLLNNGDMLLLTSDFSGLRRIKGCFVSDEEINAVTKFIKEQRRTNYDPNFLDLRTMEQINEERRQEEMTQCESNILDSDEELYQKIKEHVILNQTCSTSYIQRKFALGYSKAARMVDRLEDEGIIGPDVSGKRREILIHSLDELNGGY